MRRRSLLLATALITTGRVAQGDALADRLRQGGLCLLLRHARTEPGTGDPPGFRLDDCATQRNLDTVGRAQARAIGDQLKRMRVPIGEVLSSGWCRCRETAELIGMGAVAHYPPLDSFFEDRSRRDRQRADILAFIRGWRSSGNALLVTHQVNITAVASVFPVAGEIVVLTPAVELLGRVPPPQPGDLGG